MGRYQYPRRATCGSSSRLLFASDSDSYSLTSIKEGLTSKGKDAIMLYILLTHI